MRSLWNDDDAFNELQNCSARLFERTDDNEDKNNDFKDLNKEWSENTSQERIVCLNERRKDFRKSAKDESRVFSESRYHDENQQLNSR